MRGIIKAKMKYIAYELEPPDWEAVLTHFVWLAVHVSYVRGYMIATAGVNLL